MINKVLIEIKGTQRYGPDKEVIEMATVGTIRDNGSAYIIKYNEEQEPPDKPNKVTLMVMKDESSVELTRSGGVNSVLFIEKGNRHLCRYASEVGDMLIGVHGKDVEIALDERACGSIAFKYDIDINSSVTSQNTVELCISQRQLN